MRRDEALRIMRWCYDCEEWFDPWYRAAHEGHAVLGAVRSRQLARELVAQEAQ